MFCVALCRCFFFCLFVSPASPAARNDFSVSAVFCFMFIFFFSRLFLRLLLLHFLLPFVFRSHSFFLFYLMHSFLLFYCRSLLLFLLYSLCSFSTYFPSSSPSSTLYPPFPLTVSFLCFISLLLILFLLFPSSSSLASTYISSFLSVFPLTHTHAHCLTPNAYISILPPSPADRTPWQPSSPSWKGLWLPRKLPWQGRWQRSKMPKPNSRPSLRACW